MDSDYGMIPVPIVVPKLDKKDSDDFRPFCMRANFLDKVAGSGYVEFGKTCVLCSVEGPVEKDRDLDEDVEDENPLKILSDELDESYLNVLDQATETFVRIDQLVNPDVGVVKSEVRLHVKVVSDDGGVLAASIMAMGLALASANVQLYDLPVASTTLYRTRSATELILDPTAAECVRARKEGGGIITVIALPSFVQIGHQFVEGVLTAKQVGQATRFGFENAMRIYDDLTMTLKKSSR